MWVFRDASEIILEAFMLISLIVRHSFLAAQNFSLRKCLFDERLKKFGPPASANEVRFQ